MAFRGCNNLVSLSIPLSVTVIDSGAFRNCSLTNIGIPSSVTSIKEESFCCNETLCTVTLSENITVIGRRSLTRVLYDARCHEMQALLGCRVKRNRDPILNDKNRVDFFAIALSTTGARRTITSYISRRFSDLRFVGTNAFKWYKSLPSNQPNQNRLGLTRLTSGIEGLEILLWSLHSRIVWWSRGSSWLFVLLGLGTCYTLQYIRSKTHNLIMIIIRRRIVTTNPESRCFL